jgi:hypothetical protein
LAVNHCYIPRPPLSAFVDFFALPTSELHNQTVLLEMLWGRAAIDLREQLLAAKTRKQRFQILEQFLLARLADQARDIHPAVAYSLKEFQFTSYSHSVKNVIGQIGMSQTRFCSPRLWSRPALSLRASRSIGLCSAGLWGGGDRAF